jgi:hypothetical protein
MLTLSPKDRRKDGGKVALLSTYREEYVLLVLIDSPWVGNGASVY